MSIKLRSFAQRLKAFEDDLPRRQLLIKKEVAKEVGIQMIGDTPVDTGQARSNWWPSVGQPDRTSVYFGPFNRTPGAEVRSGTASLNRLTRFLGIVKARGRIYLTNNLPYIPRLNDGWSKQAPKRYIQRAIAAGQAIVNRQVIRFSMKGNGK